MPTEIYLDTARLGQISPTAKSESEAYLQIAERESASRWFESILLADDQRRDFGEAFSTWRGITDLKSRLRRLAGFPDDASVLLASRTKTLARIAARLFFGHTRSLLVTDLGWPDYMDLVAAHAARGGRRVVRVELIDAVLRRQATPEEILDTIIKAYRRGECDGLFLSAVSNTGITLDVMRIVSQLEMKCNLPFVVVDGAQHLGHVPAQFSEVCDLYFASTHKWLGSHLPLAVAFFGRRRSRDRIAANVQRFLAHDEIDDPLLRLMEDGEDSPQFGETVNVSSLFAASGAVDDAKTFGETIAKNRRDNIGALEEIASNVGWKPLIPHEGFRSNILLAKPNGACHVKPNDLRLRLQKRGLAVTAFHDGIVRLSAPNELLTDDQLNTVRHALKSC